MIHLEVLDIQDNCISDSLALQSLQYLCTLREVSLLICLPLHISTYVGVSTYVHSRCT